MAGLRTSKPTPIRPNLITEQGDRARLGAMSDAEITHILNLRLCCSEGVQMMQSLAKSWAVSPTLSKAAEQSKATQRNEQIKVAQTRKKTTEKVTNPAVISLESARSKRQSEAKTFQPSSDVVLEYLTWPEMHFISDVRGSNLPKVLAYLAKRHGMETLQAKLAEMGAI